MLGRRIDVQYKGQTENTIEVDGSHQDRRLELVAKDVAKYGE